jgi:hypothetical protein
LFRMKSTFAPWVLAGLLIGSGSALAKPVQLPETTVKKCAEQTARVERSAGIPRHLLTAISVAESGRWDKGRQENVAWPWTVMVKGKGHFYPNRSTAVAAVRRFQDEGITNIDVGCMQINLHYHGDAFANLHEAFDPASNVAYAAAFLKKLHKSTGSWHQAAGFYHSTTPSRFIPYKRKVARLWNQERAKTGAPASFATTGLDMSTFADFQPRFRIARASSARLVDTARTRLLNERLKERRAAQRSAAKDAGKAGGFAAKRRNQLKAWRASRVWARGS